MHQTTCAPREYGSGKVRERGFERWGSNTRLITCRSSKEHRDLNSIGEGGGGKYVCPCSHSGKADVSLRRGKLSAEFGYPETQSKGTMVCTMM